MPLPTAAVRRSFRWIDPNDQLSSAAPKPAAGFAFQSRIAPLDGLIEGRPAAFVELPTEGLTLGLTLVDAGANELAVTASTGSGVVDSVRLRPGDEQRIGSVSVGLIGFDAYLTFLSRRDPGMGILFGGAALLVACLAIALWLPRRRITLRYADGAVRLLLRGERFDRADGELAKLATRLENALRSVPA